MRGKKTICGIAALTAFLLIFAATRFTPDAFTATAFAADDGGALQTSAVWADDKNVDVTVALAHNPGLWGFTFYLNFDNTKLTPVSASNKAVYPTLKTNADAGASTDLTSLERISMSWQNSDLVDDTQIGDLVTVRFQVKSDVQPGSALDFTIEIDDPDDFSNVGFDTVPIDVDDSGSADVPVPAPASQGALQTSAVWADDKNVDVTVALAHNPGLWGFTFYLNFDNTKLTPVSASNKVVYPTLKTNADVGSGTDLTSLERISISWQNSDLVDDTQIGDLVTLRFQVKSDVQPGSALDFTIEIDDPDDFSNVGFDTVPIDVDDGSVNVTVPTPTTSSTSTTVTTTPTTSSTSTTVTTTPTTSSTSTTVTTTPTTSSTSTTVTTTPTPTTSSTSTTVTTTPTTSSTSTTVITSTSTTSTALIPIPYGDVNSDGTIDMRDLSKLFQRVAQWNISMSEIELQAADVNNDGEINMLDVLLLFKYIAKWNVTLG